MAKRKPDRIDRAAAKMIDQMSGRSGLRAEPAAKRIAALVRREVRREQKAMREAIVVVEGRWGDTVKRELIQWLDAREGR